MRYALLVYESAADIAARSSPETRESYMAPYLAYTKALIDAGVSAGGAGLQAPGFATTIRLRGGQRHVQDGPFAETKELLGGFYLLDVPDLDTALEWAARCPAAASGSVEVRPALPPPPGA
ncbi:MAG TPA: YciI family protein [Gemmatimonadales bacterium]|nr:YciI family protein [Gemmatimonadales bacterium]